ncbi:MAG: PilZ domain-containing protein [Clostridiales bacterium]|nr:PilZ domain-containing protein [Clostridiales bacterium]
MEARVFDRHNRLLFEGKASYHKEDGMVYVRAGESINIEDTYYFVQYYDNLGIFDFSCSLVGCYFDPPGYTASFKVEEITKIVQRRQDVKMKTNIPIKMILLDYNNELVIDPETKKTVQILATLRDISAGGIMIDTDYPLRINQKLMFPFDKGSTPILVTAQVIREQPQQNSYFRYGCKFINNSFAKESVIREYVFRLETATRNTARSYRD